MVIVDCHQPRLCWDWQASWSLLHNLQTTLQMPQLSTFALRNTHLQGQMFMVNTYLLSSPAENLDVASAGSGSLNSPNLPNNPLNISQVFPELLCLHKFQKSRGKVSAFTSQLQAHYRI